jgi:hypothetical protein
VFFDRSGGSLCIIHRDLGDRALPSACRHFPRKVLHDARGTLISLSHFCPTAAAMLLEAGDLSIVDAHPPLRLAGDMEGVDAREALPPLLRPGLLCDIEGYEAWERGGVALFAQTAPGYHACLDALAAATEIIREWKPGSRSLADAVRTAFVASDASVRGAWSHERAMTRIAKLTAGSAADDDLASIANFENEWVRHVGSREIAWFERGMKNYLAARLFGNWVAYQGQGLRSIVEWLRVCAALVRHFLIRRLVGSRLPLDRSAFIESVRSADLLLLHALDGGAFARDVACLEQSDGGTRII